MLVFLEKVKHIIEEESGQVRLTLHIHIKVLWKRKTNDLYFQYKEQYELTEKSYALGIAQFDYEI